MSNALPAKEPSMDEILASIRRIIESGDETVVAKTAPDLEPLHGEPANTAGNAADLAADAVVWRGDAPSRSERANPPGRPRLGIVPPVEPVDVAVADLPDEAVDDRLGLGLKAEPAAEASGLPDGHAVGTTPEEVGFRDSGDGLPPSAARLRAVSPASVSEDNEGETAELSPDSARLVGGSDQVSEADVADAIGEFDENEFTWELNENASLIAPESPMEERRDPADAGPGEAVLPPAAAANAVKQDRPEEPEGAKIVPGNAASAPIHELISQEASSRVAASFDNLARVIREEHLDSIDETVGEMLRPMLQEWLDDNLPSLVEKLVREEIERVARGGRR
ncbi:PopZ family protein [Aurantimonas marianensis]|uniref:DUF2497 domain-containing protein n=1 Tax=Aurantimonas marianensis TaxID=2920428 RepID=A0A9X2H6X9_9HYPH|nr:DUF2497 domain-containing protein [Aurantimonas marianensis]MCP3055326.1 DUF2497 domain-containing protein [Aurantimonas marianensis]